MSQVLIPSANNYYLEINWYQRQKHHQHACGDAFLSRKFGNRVVSVLADGLGSGIKAGVLATLTTTMAARFVTSNMDIRRAAEVILETLPVCSKRKIGYSTFTIVDAESTGPVRIIEYDNPSFMLFRNGQMLPVEKTRHDLQINQRSKLYFSEFTLKPEDRLVFFSDGVSQSGLGRSNLPLGWQESGVEHFITGILAENSQISAGELTKKVVYRSWENDANRAADDITCAALYFRHPRRTLVMTGPPYENKDDLLLADIARNFDGQRIACGGTTASILARELKLSISVNLPEVRPGNDIPPSATMPGFALVTEGTITLSKVLGILEEDPPLESLPDNAAKKMVTLLLNSDIIEFVVGTRINEAHQDPRLPRELEIRRNLMKKFCQVLEKSYLKETELRFI